MGSADLHIHTALGDGLPSLEQILRHTEAQTDLDVIAVTEHDNLGPALRLRELCARRPLRFEVVTGAEITTLEGHLLALFIEEPVASLRSLPSTLDAIHRQGGLAVIPHPMSYLTRSLGRRGIERIVLGRSAGLWFDGIELANPSPAGRVTAARARHWNATRYRLAPVGGSDAHFLPLIGCARTHFAGRTAANLRAAILARTTSAELRAVPSLHSIGPRALALQSLRALTATPKRVLRPGLGAWGLGLGDSAPPSPKPQAPSPGRPEGGP